MKKNSFEAPCAYMQYDEAKGKDVKTFPAVSCGHDCGKCGWNPAVREKRLERRAEKCTRERLAASAERR